MYEAAAGAVFGLCMQPVKEARDVVQFGPTLNEFQIPATGEHAVPRGFLDALLWAMTTKTGIRLAGWGLAMDIATGLIRGPVRELVNPKIFELVMSFSPGVQEHPMSILLADLISNLPESCISHGVDALHVRRSCRMLGIPVAPNVAPLDLYRGFVGQRIITIVGIWTYQSIQIVLHNSISSILEVDNAYDPLTHLAVGIAPTIIAGLLTYPLDTIRRRMLVDTVTSTCRFNGPIDAGWKIWTEGGFEHFYAGAPVNIGMGMISYTIVILLGGISK